MSDPSPYARELEHQLRTARQQLRVQAAELTQLRDVLHEKNLALDALHYVWCSGGCATGIHRWEHGPLTAAIVAEAERNTHRLRAWWHAHQDRVARAQPHRTLWQRLWPWKKTRPPA
jgi:hypothetical protein